MGQVGFRTAVEVGIGAIGLDILAGDCARRQLLDEINKIILGLLGVLDELGRNGGEERELLGAVKRGDLVVILGNEGVIPSLEVLLQNFGSGVTPREGGNSARNLCFGGAEPRGRAADNDESGWANRADKILHHQDVAAGEWRASNEWRGGWGLGGESECLPLRWES